MEEVKVVAMVVAAAMVEAAMMEASMVEAAMVEAETMAAARAAARAAAGLRAPVPVVGWPPGAPAVGGARLRWVAPMWRLRRRAGVPQAAPAAGDLR